MFVEWNLVNYKEPHFQFKLRAGPGFQRKRGETLLESVDCLVNQIRIKREFSEEILKFLP